MNHAAKGRPLETDYTHMAEVRGQPQQYRRRRRRRRKEVAKEIYREAQKTEEEQDEAQYRGSQANQREEKKNVLEARSKHVREQRAKQD